MTIDLILLDKFNTSDHICVLAEGNQANALSRILYLADATT